jgi:predicted nucleic acid-binding protein
MALAQEYLVDTNILLRASREEDPEHEIVTSALLFLEAERTALYYSLQNVAEFWNVCTRPADRNGYGLSAAETNRRVESIEQRMTFLPDSDQVYSIWRQLVIANNVLGVQVHDARLAAIMRAYGITHILTLNQPDFLRYSNIRAVHPNQVHLSPR